MLTVDYLEPCTQSRPLATFASQHPLVDKVAPEKIADNLQAHVRIHLADCQRAQLFPKVSDDLRTTLSRRSYRLGLLGQSSSCDLLGEGPVTKRSRVPRGEPTVVTTPRRQAFLRRLGAYGQVRDGTRPFSHDYLEDP